MRVTILILSLISACLATGAWKVSDVDRTVDLTTQIVKTSSLFKYENTDAKEQKDLLVAIPTAEAEKLSYMVIREDGQKNKLKITKQNIEKGFQLYKIDLSKAVAKGAQVKLKVEYRVTGVLSPYPTAIAQNQPQFIKAHLTSHVSAAYPVTKEKTTYKIPGNLVDNKNKENGKVVYGPYSDQPAFNAQFVDLHYECNFPFVVATVVERLIEVSHWGGNIAVEEYIELENKGADLKGTFSRLEHSGDRRGQSQRPHLQHFTTILPASAKDIYYRDEIGNISTSAIRIRTDSVELTVTPRFPLFGGWKTSYVIGYNVPSYEYLYNNGNNYALKMRVLDHIFENIVVEKLTTKVVLPEHVKNIKVNTPYTMDRRPDEVKASYLDTVGRQIVILQKDNLVSEHIQNFNISYDFEAIQLLREPVLVICFFFIIFFSIIVYVRLDFSLSSDPTSKIIEELSVIVRRLDALASRKSKLYTNFVDEITAFKESRDESALIEAKKQLDDGRHAVNSYISDLLTSAKPKFGEAAVKASELLKYDKPLFDSVDGYIAATIKSKQKTSPEDGKFAEKAVEARRKAEKIIDSLSSE